MVYKNIHQVMAAQSDLVTILGQFDPKLVKMAPAGGAAGRLMRHRTFPFMPWKRRLR